MRSRGPRSHVNVYVIMSLNTLIFRHITSQRGDGLGAIVFVAYFSFSVCLLAIQENGYVIVMNISKQTVTGLLGHWAKIQVSGSNVSVVNVAT